MNKGIQKNNISDENDGTNCRKTWWWTTYQLKKPQKPGSAHWALLARLNFLESTDGESVGSNLEYCLNVFFRPTRESSETNRVPVLCRIQPSRANEYSDKSKQYFDYCNVSIWFYLTCTIFQRYWSESISQNNLTSGKNTRCTLCTI